MNVLRRILPPVLIALLPMAMLYTLWLNPTSAGEDDVVYFYPLHKLVGQEIRHGYWPGLNRFEATGTSLMEVGVMYPPMWVFAAMPARLAYSLTLFAGFGLAGLGAYVYLRRLGLVRPAACFGAVAFMFCGFLVGHRVHWSVLHAAAWLPWGLWCIELLRRPRPVAAFVALVPVAWLAMTVGHWPTFIHMSVIWMAYLLLRGRPLVRSLIVAGLGLAIALALAAPQIDAAMQLIAAATRNRMGYATAGENSFHPASAVLALFPMLLGSRTPNFFATPWWGPWHLCETLGYVGLVTLVLAGAAVWKVYRRPRAAGGCVHGVGGMDGVDNMDAVDGADSAAAFRPLVRTWTWIALGAMVWMLGYYLPTYWLIYKLPVLGYVRCPSRMVLAVDMALASLAAVAVHVVITGRREKGTGSESACCWSIRCLSPLLPGPSPLDAAIWRGATRVLPAAMVGVLVLYAAVGGVSMFLSGGQVAGWDGSPGWQMITAGLPTRPAVWVPFLLAAATGGVVLAWLAAPARRAPLLVLLLLADLLFVTRFVDVPAGVTAGPDPEKSPAAEWLRANPPAGDRPYMVWGIGQAYNDRPAELLLPKTAHGLGISTINSYGPFQSPAHAHLLGFRIFGTNRDWAWLIRRNILLSEYGVRFILTARRDVRAVIESVRVPMAPPPADGPNLLTDTWRLDGVRRDANGVMTLRTPIRWWWSMATQPVTPTPGTIYRIALDARGLRDGAANYLRAEIYSEAANLPWEQQDGLGLMAPAEQIATDWRHFEWTFQAPSPPAVTPATKGAATLFRLFTQSERPIDVRNVSMRASHWPVPVDPNGTLKPGQPLYRLAAELPATSAGDPPVAIYENRLAKEWAELGVMVQLYQSFGVAPSSADIERLRWADAAGWKEAQTAQEFLALRTVGVRIQNEGRQTRLLVAFAPAAVGLYVLVAGILLALSRRRTAEAPSGGRP